MPRLTKRLVDALAPREASYFVWDDEVTGFGIRVMPSGTRTYQVQYRKGGRTRRASIGKHGTVTADQARQTARQMLGVVAGGGDPVEDALRHRAAPTMAALCDRVLATHAAERCKPSTRLEYERVCRRFIKPALGGFKVVDVTRKDVAALHQKLSATPYQANRAVLILSKMFNLAEVWGLRPDGSNPCRHVPKFRQRKRERFLSVAEMARLGEVLAEAEAERRYSPYLLAAIRLLILTGCRKSEIQTLKWAYVTETALELPDTKTGARRVPLPGAARAVLDGLTPVEGNPYVIARSGTAGFDTGLQRIWDRIRTEAGLKDVRLHDLRHNYASAAVSAGMPIQMVGKLLGHSELQSTMRYAHLADDPIRAAAEQNACALGAALGLRVGPGKARLRLVT